MIISRSFLRVVVCVPSSATTFYDINALLASTAPSQTTTVLLTSHGPCHPCAVRHTLMNSLTAVSLGCTGEAERFMRLSGRVGYILPFTAPPPPPHHRRREQ